MESKKTLVKYRLPILILFITFALSFLATIGIDIGDLFFGKNEMYFNSTKYISVMGVLAAVGVFLNQYLGGGSYLEFKSVKIKEDKNSKQTQEELLALRKELNDFKENTVNESQIDEIIKTLNEKIKHEAASDLLNEYKVLANKNISDAAETRLECHFLRIMSRLTGEIKELGKRAKINLIIGSITALSGVSIFMLFVFERVSPDAANNYLVTEFAPRISLVIVIEVFAYFFLGLYKSNLSEIKYFHNELTNVESKYIALEEGNAIDDSSIIKDIVKELSQTERNFLLKKGESTTAIEEKRIVLEEQRGFISNLTSTLSNSKK